MRNSLLQVLYRILRVIGVALRALCENTIPPSPRRAFPCFSLSRRLN